jgi:hypothetical protein
VKELKRHTRRSIDRVTSDKCLSFVICAVLRGGRESLYSATYPSQLSWSPHAQLLNEYNLDMFGTRIAAVMRRMENIVRFSQAG